jgi:hypothetical protein
MADGTHCYIHAFGNSFNVGPVINESGQKENSATNNYDCREKFNCWASENPGERIYIHLQFFLQAFYNGQQFRCVRLATQQNYFFYEASKKIVYPIVDPSNVNY